MRAGLAKSGGAPVPPAGAGEVKEAEKQLAAQNED